MIWRRYPDVTYVPDHGNRFVRDESLRRAIRVREVVRLLAASAVLVALLFGVYLVSVIEGLAGWGLAVLMILALSLAGAVISKLRFLKAAPICCAVCSREMLRERQPGPGGGDALFFVCHPCKRYVDSGETNPG